MCVRDNNKCGVGSTLRLDLWSSWSVREMTAASVRGIHVRLSTGPEAMRFSI